MDTTLLPDNNPLACREVSLAMKQWSLKCARYSCKPYAARLFSGSPGDEFSRACFGAGCFWGTEKFFTHDFMKMHPLAEITNGRTGYMGLVNSKKYPTYREVCSGRTGHVEVYDFLFQGGDSMYAKLCKHFFSFHDPTTMNRQGNDYGTQYASVIFCYSPEHIQVAQRIRSDFQLLVDQKGVRYTGDKIVTDIRTSTDFFSAEEEHQGYLVKNPGGYCNHFYRLDVNKP